MNDETLVGAVLAAEPGAFERLIQAHERLVAHLVFRLVDNPSDREEVCQDVFLKVHRQLHRFRFESQLSTWIARIAYNTAVNHLSRKRVVQVEVDDSMPDERAEPADVLGDDQLRDWIHGQLAKLPLLEKTIVTFYHLEEMSIAEIAEIMDRPQGTIKSDLYRARRKLKDLLEKVERA